MKSVFNRLSVGLATAMIVLAQVVMPVQAAYAWTPDPSVDPDTNKKSYVCKMVGTPGVDERLQTGNNPIQVARKDDDVVGTYFTDAHEGSYIVGFGYPSEPQNQQPTLGDCFTLVTPAPEITTTLCTPGTNSTDSVNVKLTNNDSVVGNSVVYTVTIDGVTQSTAALADDASQILIFTGLAAGSYPVTVSAYGGVVYTGTVQVNSCTTPPAPIIPTVTIEGICGLNNDRAVASISDDYTSSAPVWTNSTVSVTFTINDGVDKVFINGEKTITVTGNELDTSACEVPATEIAAPSVTVNPVCGIGNDTLSVPTSEDYTSSVVWNDAHTSAMVTFTIKASVNKIFSVNGTKTITVDVDEVNSEKCPQTVKKCTEFNTPFIVTQKADFAGPGVGYSDDIGVGTYGFVDDGLKLSTADDTQKVAWYHFTSYKLADIGIPAMSYSPESGTLPGLQLVVDFDGTGSYNMLVGESVYGNNWWLTNGSSASAKLNAPHTGGGNGSLWYGTLDEWLTSFPNATVKAIGFSLGRGPIGTGTLHSLTFSCDTWDFQAPDEGGQGGGTDQPPTGGNPTPTPTPAPVVPGKGAGVTQPVTELPETGAGTNALMIGLLASAAAYGAVYFAQPKRRYE